MNRRRLREAGPEILAWSGLALSLLVLFFKLGDARAPDVHDWVNGDTLGGTAFAVDVLRDGFPISGWHFSIAPFCVPDLLLAAFFWEVTRSPVAATLLAGFSQAALLIGALLVIRNAVGLGERRLQAVLTLGVASAIALYSAHHLNVRLPDYSLLFAPQNHVGSLINMLYALGLALWLVRDEVERGRGRRAVYLGYAALCLAAGASNLMFVDEMLAPFAATLFGAAFLGLLPWRCCWTTPLLGFPAALLGAFAGRSFLHSAPLSSQSEWTIDGFLTATNAFLSGAVHNLAAHDFLHMVAATWVLFCLVSGALFVRRLVIHGTACVGREDRLRFVFVTTVFLSGVFCLASLLITGTSGLTAFHNYAWALHYLPMLFLLPLFVVPALISWSWGMRLRSVVRERVAWLAAGLAVATPAVSLAMTTVPATQITSFHPPVVAVLDDLAPQYGIREGLSGYWEARLITLLSRQGVRAYAVDGDMQPYLWWSNAAWYSESYYDRRRPPRVDFVVLDEPVGPEQRGLVINRFGEPRAERRVDNFDILIFRWPEGDSDEENAALVNFSQSLRSPIHEARAEAGRTLDVPVTVENDGKDSWASVGRFPVRLSYLWLAPGLAMRIEGRRLALPAMGPGESTQVTVRAVVPPEAAKAPGGKATLRISLVQEHVAWFYEHGGAPLDVQVLVRTHG